MNTKVNRIEKETKQKSSSLASKLFWVLAIVCVAVIIWGNDYFVDKPIIRILGIAVFAILAVVFCLLTQQGKKFIQFAQEAKIELYKVVWPTRKETINTTLLVAVLTIVVGLCLWGIDTLFMKIIGWLTGASF